MTEGESLLTRSLAVVIPTLNAQAVLPATLGSLGSDLRVVLADSGSTDETREVARSAGAAVIVAPRGRGAQLAAGAAGCREEWLLFLHADTRLQPGWRAAAAAFLADPASRERAGFFRLRFDCANLHARRVEALANWRAAVMGLPYGDQGLLIGRAFFESIGGFRPLPLMEDVDLVRRVGRARLCALPGTAVTSAVRYERDGWWARPMRNMGCLALYFAGVPPRLIERLYG